MVIAAGDGRSLLAEARICLMLVELPPIPGSRI